MQQYFKHFHVCRWAQGPIAAVIDLRARHKFISQDVAGLHIVFFYEAVRLGQKDALTTKDAQYSTTFPCALALVHGTVMSRHVADEALSNPEAQRLSAVLSMDEDDYANRLFQHQDMALEEVLLQSGGILKTGWFQPKWNAAAPPTQSELEGKFHAYARHVLGQARSDALRLAVMSLDKTEAQPLFHLLAQPIN